jgi:hypothetical protein
VAAVGADNQVGANFYLTLRSFSVYSGDTIVFDEEIGDFGFHLQVELRIRLGFGGNEIEEIPLGHEADEFAVRGEMGEIGDGYGEIVNDRADRGDFLMGDAQKFLEQAELVHEFEGGGMDGVAAEIAEKVGVFFEDGDFDSGAGEKKTKNHAGGAAANDAAAEFVRRSCEGG